MDCSEFLARFSEYYDGGEVPVEGEAMEAHLQSCSSCRRYHRVVTRGGQMLRALPKPPVPPDFHPRLQHRIYHVADEAALSRSMSSGTTGATAVAMAVLVTVAAWTPSVADPAPTVELPPIVVQTPPAFVPRFGPPDPVLRSPSTLFDTNPSGSGHRLWANTHSLMYEYSPLSARYRQAADIRRSELE